MSKPTPANTVVADTTAQVIELLNASLTPSGFQTAQTRFWDTSNPKFKVAVIATRTALMVSLAFEQRPGCWHQTGNFANWPEVLEFGQQCGINAATSVRINKFIQYDNVVGFTTGLIAKVRPLEAKPA